MEDRLERLPPLPAAPDLARNGPGREGGGSARPFAAAGGVGPGPLTGRVAKVEDRLDRLPPPAAPDLGPLTGRVAKVEDRLDRLPPPAAPDLGPLTGRVAKVEDRLDRLPTLPAAPDLGPLTGRVVKVEDRLDRLPPPAAPDLGPLTARVAKVEDRLDHPPSPPPATSFPTTEAGLTFDQKKEIQKALNFSGRQVDGIFGPNTRRAITVRRRSDKVNTTGDLTPGEIKELLSPRNP